MNFYGFILALEMLNVKILKIFSFIRYMLKSDYVCMYSQ